MSKRRHPRPLGAAPSFSASKTNSTNHLSFSGKFPTQVDQRKRGTQSTRLSNRSSLIVAPHGAPTLNVAAAHSVSQCPTEDQLMLPPPFVRLEKTSPQPVHQTSTRGITALSGHMPRENRKERYNVPFCCSYTQAWKWKLGVPIQGGGSSDITCIAILFRFFSEL